MKAFRHTGSVVCMIAASVAAAGLHAETAYLQAAGSDVAAALTDASYWNPAIAPEGETGADTDFVVQDGLTLRTATTTSSFAGRSLQLGASDFSSAGNVKNDKNWAISVSDLRLYKGRWSYMSNRPQTLLGNATVYSPASDPFVLNFTGFTDSHMDFTLTGDETSAIRLTTWQGTNQGADTKPLWLRTDQSGTYSGSWSIGKGVYLIMTKAKVFGKPLSVFNPSSLKVQTNVKFRYEGGSTWAASDNRGLMLDAKGGSVDYFMVNNFTHDFGWPIDGEGEFKITGNGVFKLRSPCDVKIAVAGNAYTRLVLCSGSSVTAGGGLELPDGHLLSLETTGDDVTVNNLTASDMMLKLPVSADGSSVAKLRLAGDVNLSGVTGIGFSQVPNVAAATNLPVIVIDSSVTREFSADDFNPFAVSGCQIPNAIGVKVERDPVTGDQVVYVRLVPYVRTTVGAGGPAWAYFEAWAWGDKTAAPEVGDGKYYLTWDTHVGNKGEDASLTVPGESLILYNPTRKDFGMNLRTAKTTFNRLLALDRTMIYAVSYGTGNTPTRGKPHEVAGNVTVQTTPGQEFSLIAARSQINVTATVTGSGTIRARSTANVYTPPCKVSFSAENTGYDGAVHVYNNVDVTRNICGLTIAKEENLGGNPRRFDPDALMLGYGSVFAPAAAVTIDDANRGVTFTSSTNLESQVWTGATLDLANDFTINTPVVFDKGIYVKTNSAMFAWGKGGVTVAEDVTLLVKDGTVKPQGFGALGGMSLSFAEGAAMAFDLPIAAGDSRSVYGVDMRGVTLDNAAAKLAVRVDVDADAVEGGTASAPLATFADAGSAQAFIDGATVSQTCGYKVSLSVVTQTLEDVEVATVSAKAVKVGFAIVIR